LDEETGQAGLVACDTAHVPEPLGLPKGSIRALVAIDMAVTCLLMILLGRDVPNSLLALLLTIVGYYFGFRVKVEAEASRIYDASGLTRRPLHLPPGVVRFVLIGGFVVGALVLAARGRLGEVKYLEFYVLMAGLTCGHLFGRVMASSRGTPGYTLINHAKGAIMLGVGAVLAVFFISGLSADWPGWIVMVLCAAVSFYFGSRT